jgi:uncharacterized ion transporter superfamily protein YfcC
VLPAGEFDRDGRQVISGTYHQVETDPLPPFSFLTAIPSGLAAAQDVIFFVFMVGGVIAVIRATGAIDALIGYAIRNLGSRPSTLIGGMVLLFALGSSTIGMAEEYLPFVPILVSMCLALKMDAVVAVGIIYIGAGVGYACAALNPFTVLIAQDIAGLALTSGQGFRWLLLLVCVIVGVHHLLGYAHRLMRDPKTSLVFDVDYSKGFQMPDDVHLTPSRIFVLLVFSLAVGLFIYGVAAWEWYLVELTAILLGVALIAAVVGRLGPNTTASVFCVGSAELTTTALLIGFARTIQVILSDAKVIDTIIIGLADPLLMLPSTMAAVGMLAVQTACNFFIPSGSGQAYVTMPIMSPLADLTSLTRQTAVLAYQFGDGFTNMIVPTNAVLMGVLALGRIPYQRWVRFILPLLAKLYVIAIVALIVAVQISY